MIPGGRVYDQANAERGFEKLMQLFDDTLQSTILDGEFRSRGMSRGLSDISRAGEIFTPPATI
jgi:hypothetical protein